MPVQVDGHALLRDAFEDGLAPAEVRVVQLLDSFGRQLLLQRAPRLVASVAAGLSLGAQERFALGPHEAGGVDEPRERLERGVTDRAFRSRLDL